RLISAPESVTYGQNFFVETPDAALVTKVTWVRLPSVTHAFDANQRFNRLQPVMQVPGGIEVMTPGDRNRCPPGDYMVFALNAAGVPSRAKIVRIA
ncbi:MAG: galactose oxidase early set domain-containing protein, partial [Acidimicrobiia bacterium]